MVIKGSARNAPGELAYHLLREDTNELVSLLELSGVAALDLRRALHELDGMGAGSRSRRTLYHASINTPVAEQLTPQQQRIARERLAGRMGLADQPYAVVQHVKHGRQHTHVVWSRIDVETGKAIPDSHNYRKHEEVARELEREFGHERVLGAHVRDKQQEARPSRGPTWGEQRQAERSGLTPAAAKSVISELWRRTQTGTEFAHELEAHGFTLARGDRRDFVLIDGAGEVHGLTRRIEGVKAAQIRERMADIDVGSLPDVEAARLRVNARDPGREVGPGFVGVVERMRLEERREEGDRPSSRPRLANADREAAAALRQLQRTMAAQIDAVVVGRSGGDRTAGDRTSSPEAETRPVSLPPQPPLIPEPAMPAIPAAAERTRESGSFLGRVAGWFRRREQGREPDMPGPAPSHREAAQENSPRADPREHRPSAYLFIRLFGMIVEAYQHALDKAIETQPDRQAHRDVAAASLPMTGSPTTARPVAKETRDDLFDEARRRQAEKTLIEDGLAKLRRDEERRRPDSGPGHER